MSTEHELTAREAEAQELILKAFEAIKNLGKDDGNSTLVYNNAELAQAVHVLQSFLKQKVLNRLMPEEFSNWWTDSFHEHI